jgi:hypothetical protein
VSQSFFSFTSAAVKAPSSAIDCEMMWSPAFQALEVTLKLSSSLDRPMYEVFATSDSAKFLTLEHEVAC